MNINQHNYEEYFLLYADKELSGEERVEVEKFIQQHPELEEEFDMINSTIMEPETFQLKDKSFLLKPIGTEFINNHNYEEIFVLYHDGELTGEQEEQTNEFLKEHPELKDEFSLISRAKMQTDPVFFPDKKSLLRKEHSGVGGRIILFRSLAAAAVLGFGLWIAVLYFSESDSQNPIAQQVATPASPAQKNTGSTTIETDDSSVATIEKTETQSENKKEIQIEKAESNAGVASKESEEKLNNKKEIILAKKEQDPGITPEQEKSIQPSEINAKRGKKAEVMIAQIPPLKISSSDVISRNQLAHVDVNITPRVIENNYPVQNAVHLNVSKEPSGNYIFYNVPEEEFRKTKIGGFLKKLKRVAERNDPIRRLFVGDDGQVASNE